MLGPRINVSLNSYKSNVQGDSPEVASVKALRASLIFFISENLKTDENHAYTGDDEKGPMLEHIMSVTGMTREEANQFIGPESETPSIEVLFKTLVRMGARIVLTAYYPYEYKEVLRA